MLKTDRYTKLGFFALLIGHVLAAYFSFGYHHPDEHFQILEWANYFIGETPDSSHLPWEFAAQIRPWFQPLCHAIFLKFLLAAGLNPFDIAFFFRLIYAALNIWSILALWNYFKNKYELNTKWFLLIGLLWFFPYAHVRTSSENLAGIFLSFALLALLKDSSSLRSFFNVGLLFGFAFLARYQIALGLAGLGAILLLNDRGLRKKHILLLSGFVLPITLGVLLDRIGYGNWVFTPWQYFKVNILDHVAAQYNPYPWYQYLVWIAQLNPFISLPLFYGVIRYSLRYKKDLLTAFVMSFFILHCFITNKEYRFLMPILNIAPFMAVAYFRGVNLPAFTQSKAFLFSYVAINLIAFAISSFHGASTQTHWPQHAVYRNFKSHPNTTWLSNRDYLVDSGKQFYDLKKVSGFEPHEFHLFHNAAELLDLLEKHPNAIVMIDGGLRDPITVGMVTVVESKGCNLITSAFPKILSEKTKIPYQALYHCKPL